MELNHQPTKVKCSVRSSMGNEHWRKSVVGVLNVLTYLTFIILILTKKI